jgi:hypothetical protein
VTWVFFRQKRQENSISKERIESLKSEFLRLKEELDDHFHSINDNTGEIEIQNSFICEIDNRMAKMEEKMDEVHMFLKQIASKTVSAELTRDEQRVFLQLYTNEGFMTPDNICSKGLMDVSVVQESLVMMMEKGVPIEREILDSKLYFRLNKRFKLKQAKEQVIKIDPEVTGQFQNTLLEQFFEA